MTSSFVAVSKNPNDDDEEELNDEATDRPLVKASASNQIGEVNFAFS